MKRSGIITLLTDFGLKDPYVAMMKGVILSINPFARIVDITHSLACGDISQAARHLVSTFGYFPEGSVHVAVVDPGVGGDRRLVALEVKNHFFTGPDNGLFSAVIEKYGPARIFEVTEEGYFLTPVTKTFHGRDVFAPIAAHISMGKGLEDLGKPLDDPVKSILPLPIMSEGFLYGLTTGNDIFGNIATNITARDLLAFAGESVPVIEIEGITIRGLNETYSDVKIGEPLALINSSGFLEISVNMDSAEKYLKAVTSRTTVDARVKISRGE